MRDNIISKQFCSVMVERPKDFSHTGISNMPWYCKAMAISKSCKQPLKPGLLALCWDRLTEFCMYPTLSKAIPGPKQISSPDPLLYLTNNSKLKNDDVEAVASVKCWPFVSPWASGWLRTYYVYDRYLCPVEIRRNQVSCVHTISLDLPHIKLCCRLRGRSTSHPR